MHVPRSLQTIVICYVHSMCTYISMNEWNILHNFRPLINAPNFSRHYNYIFFGRAERFLDREITIVFDEIIILFFIVVFQVVKLRINVLKHLVFFPDSFTRSIFGTAFFCSAFLWDFSLCQRRRFVIVRLTTPCLTSNIIDDRTSITNVDRKRHFNGFNVEIAVS